LTAKGELSDHLASRFASDGTTACSLPRTRRADGRRWGEIYLDVEERNDEIRKSGVTPFRNRKAHMKGVTFRAFS